MTSAKARITVGMRWWAGLPTDALRRPTPSLVLTSHPGFGPPSGGWPHFRRDCLASYLKKPAIPFEEAIARVDWWTIGDALNVLDELGHPGAMTVRDLYERLYRYMVSTEREDHERAHAVAMRRISDRGARRATLATQRKRAREAAWRERAGGNSRGAQLCSPASRKGGGVMGRCHTTKRCAWEDAALTTADEIRDALRREPRDYRTERALARRWRQAVQRFGIQFHVVRSPFVAPEYGGDRRSALAFVSFRSPPMVAFIVIAPGLTRREQDREVARHVRALWRDFSGYARPEH